MFLIETMRHGSHFETVFLVNSSSVLSLHYSIFSFFFFSAALAFIPFDNTGAVRGLQTNSKATVDEKNIW